MVNTTWVLTPWADVLYASDLKWWESEAGQGAIAGFPGLKVSHDAAACQRYDLRKVYLREVADGILSNEIDTVPPYIGAAGNSGFQALNLAYHFGAATILLLGFDMHGEHWHGPHPAGMNNAGKEQFENWAPHFAAARTRLDALGVRVVNCTPGSALEAFERGELGDFR